MVVNFFFPVSSRWKVVVFRWAIPVVFDMTTISTQRNQTQLMPILFIVRSSLKFTTCFGLSSIRPLLDHKSFIEETIQYMLQYINQFIVIQRDFVFRP